MLTKSNHLQWVVCVGTCPYINGKRLPGLMSNFLLIKMDIMIYVRHYTGKTVAPTRLAENDSDGSNIIV